MWRKINIFLLVLLAALLIWNIRIASIGARQATECEKTCGAGYETNRWHRACGIEIQGCHITQCDQHSLGCGYGDNFNDYCYLAWHYCVDS
jgi:hypothetical protein